MIGQKTKLRRSTPKVKTGCLTCKIRRIKCDETKPHCTRCTTTGRKCDGYPPPKTYAAASTANSTPISSNSWINNTMESQLIHQRAITSVTSRPSLARPSSFYTGMGDSLKYLEFYYHCAGHTLSSYFDSEFWSRTVLQLGHSEPAIRHALVAVGYLCQTESGDIKEARLRLRPEQTDLSFLRHYNRAVSSLVNSMKDRPSARIETALVACVLFVCMEYLRGNYRTGFDHLMSGLNLLSEWQMKQLQRLEQQASESELQPLRQSDSQLLLPMVSKENPVSSLASLYPYPSSSSIIEEILIPIFVRMSTNALLFNQELPHLNPCSYTTPEYEQRPTFENIRQANAILGEICNSSLVFVRMAAFKRHFVPFTSDELEHQRHLMDCFRVWKQRLDTFEQQNRHRQTEEDKLAISSMLIVYGISEIWTSCCTDLGEMLYDTRLDDFKTTLAHATIAVNAATTIIQAEHQQQQQQRRLRTANFTFEMSLVAPLFFIACRCRCPQTRREAIALLARNPPREGLWDARQCKLVAMRAIQLEESGLLDPTSSFPSSWPSGSARLHTILIGGDLDSSGNFAVGFRSQPDGPGTATRDWTETLTL